MSSPLTLRTGRVIPQRWLLRLTLAMVCALSARAAHAVLDTPPIPDAPANVVMLLKWCWEHKDIQRYRDLFTADFRFTSGSDLAWGRDEELATVGHLFGGGTPTQASVSSLSLGYLGLLLPGTDSSLGRTWPWHQQALLPAVLVMSRGDGSNLQGEGLTLFYLVRGDSAAIPADMQARGIRPDSTRWYIERWEDQPSGVTIDHAPAITALSTLTAYSGRPLTMNVTVFDQEEDTITSLTADVPPGASFVPGPDNTTAQFRWTPTLADVGDRVVTIHAANQLWSDFVTRVTVRSAGLRASLAANPSTGSDPLFVRLDASGTTSPNANVIRYVFDFGDGSSWTQGYGIVTHTYRVGTWTAKVTAFDSFEAVDSAKATIVVKHVNTPPAAAMTCTPTSGKPPLTVRLDASAAKDDDGHIVSYRFYFGDGKDTTQTTPIATHVYQVGNPMAKVTVVDDLGDSASVSIPLDIHGDRPPAVVAPPTWSMLVADSLKLDVIVTDPDGDAIASLTANLPAGAAFVPAADNRSGRMTWTPGLSDLGVHRVSFVAANALTDSAVVMITVSEHPPDRPPVVVAPASVAGKAGKQLSFSVTVSDSDRNPIASLAAALPVGAHFAPGAGNLSGTFTWTPSVQDVGVHVVTFTASNALTGTAQTSIEVRPPNAIPVATMSVTPTSGTEPLTVHFNAAGSYDTDGRVISYFYDYGDGTHAQLASPEATHTYAAGSWRPRLTVYDDDDATGSMDVAVQVAAVRSVAGALGAITKLESSWRDRSLARYRELFTADFRFAFADDDSVGDRYPGRTWTREDELLAAGRLFAGGNGAEPPATSIGLGADAAIAGSSYVPGRSYPWHMQVLVPNIGLDVSRGDAPSLHVQGRALFSVVRGDSARIPQELLDLGFRPDSTQWYIEGWRDMTGLGGAVNHPPSASIALSPAIGVDPLLVRVDASRSRDDDGTIKNYRFDFGDGDSFSQTSPVCLHTFHAGDWYVTVTVTDDQGSLSSAGVPITVLAPGTEPNLARNPSFESDLKGWNSYAGSLLQRVDGSGHDGNVGLQVAGPPAINGSFGVNDSPDMVRWTLSPGIHYRYTAWVRSPSSHGQAKLRVTEYLISSGAKLGMATSTPVSLSPEWQQLTVDYTTTATNSTLDFQVRDFPLVGSELFFTDDVSVRNVSAPGAGTGMASWYDGEHDPVALEPRLTPSPMHDSGTLRFMTSQPGALRVEVLDIAGRRVRGLMNEREAPAGLYELPITRAGDDGGRLRPGMYFWRIQSPEGAKTGRFVMLQ